MKRLIELFFRGLASFSQFLENASARRQKKYAYFFCVLQILVSLFSISIAIICFVLYYEKLSELNLILFAILLLAACFFMLGAYIHMIVTRDMRHIRSQYANEEDPVKKNKIEF